MSGRNLWKDIKRHPKCPYCKHTMRSHQLLSDISEIMDVDIWSCDTCERDQQYCTTKGPIDSVKKKKKRPPEPFSGGKL